MEVLMPFSCVAEANLGGIHQAVNLILFRCETLMGFSRARMIAVGGFLGPGSRE